MTVKEAISHFPATFRLRSRDFAGLDFRINERKSWDDPDKGLQLVVEVCRDGVWMDFGRVTYAELTDEAVIPEPTACWRPLIDKIGAGACGEFMHMGMDKSGKINLYKHRDTRAYLNLDEQGNCYAYHQPTGTYNKVLNEAHAFEYFPELLPTPAQPMTLTITLAPAKFPRTHIAGRVAAEYVAAALGKLEASAWTELMRDGSLSGKVDAEFMGEATWTLTADRC